MRDEGEGGSEVGKRAQVGMVEGGDSAGSRRNVIALELALTQAPQRV